jgi:CDP-diacylglycerol--glycerol-3-phosphate 3-phosphatidyltransferase
VKGIFAHWPNRITALRFVGALVLFVLFALMGERDSEESLEVLGVALSMRTAIGICFWLFVVVAATDALDGYLARHGGHVSAFGRIADPFVDKILILGVMIFMAVMPWSRTYIPAWLVVLILSREFLVTGLRGFVESLGREFPADWFGKSKMILQCMAVGGVMWIPAYAWPDWLHTFWVVLVRILVAATLLTTVGSGVTYVLRTRRILLEEGSR